MTAFGAVLGLSSQALFFEVITEKTDLGEVAFEFRAVVVSHVGDLAITEPMQAQQKVFGVAGSSGGDGTHLDTSFMGRP